MDLSSIRADLLKTVDLALATKDTQSYIETVVAAEHFDPREPAPNIIEWVAGPKWLNVSTVYDYTRQYQMLRDFMQLRCPICNSPAPEAKDCAGKSRETLQSEVLLVWDKSEQDDVCPKCGTTRMEFETDGLLTWYDTFVACVGMRGGKSALAAEIASFIEHRLFTMGDLGKYFGLLANQPFEVAFVATTGTQIGKTIYALYRAMRDQSPWFKSYIQFLKSLGKVVGRELYVENTKIIENRWTNVNFASLNSNSGGLAGSTRIATFIDELSRFDLTESKRSADEVWAVLENSLLTVRSTRSNKRIPNWCGSMVAVSSPISKYDKTMRQLALKREGKADRTFAVHMRTEEFNPTITKEVLQPYFEKDPVKAERDFGANPPSADSPLIEDFDAFKKQATDYNLKPLVHFEQFIRIVGEQERIGAKVLMGMLEPDYVHFVCFDAGKSGNAYAGASAHGEWQNIDGRQVWTVIYDWVLSLRPDMALRRIVDFTCIPTLIKDLQQRCKIGKVSFDRWNSESTAQEIIDMGIEVDLSSVTAQDYSEFVSMAKGGQLRMLPPAGDDSVKRPKDMSDQGKVFHELSILSRSEDLKKVFSTKKGVSPLEMSDDLAQVVVKCSRMVRTQVATINVSRKDAAKSAMFKDKSGSFLNVGSVASVRGMGRGGMSTFGDHNGLFGKNW